MKIVRLVKDLVQEVQEDRKVLAKRHEDDAEWKAAGSPVGADYVKWKEARKLHGS